MSLNGALNIGRTALSAAQTALQVTGNNMANAATPGYHRQTVHMASVAGEQLGQGLFVGRGVEIQTIRREIDVALQGRLRDAISQESAAFIDDRFLASIESLQGELSDNDVSSLLNSFFNAFSELANNPGDSALRTVVVQEGLGLAGRLRGLRDDYAVVRTEIDQALADAVSAADELLTQIETINRRIVDAEAGAGQANDLRDQRDVAIDQLAEFMDVTVIQQPSGSVDILVGSTPIMLAGESRGLELQADEVAGLTQLSVHVRDDGSQLVIDSGRVGALLTQRQQTVDPAIETLDTFAAQLILQVNRVHSQGQGQGGFGSVEGTADIDDTAANLNSAAAGLPFRVENGSFFIHVTHAGSGLRTTHQIEVDGDADSLDDLVNRINVTVGVPNVTAATGMRNHLTLTAGSGYEITFSDDSSGALAALGVNTFFTGKDALDIDVNQVIQDDSSMLAAGSGHVPGSNGTALALAGLSGEGVDELGGASLDQYWLDHVNTMAGKAASARLTLESSVLVRESLSAQAQAVSGVSLDEESINLLNYQRQFQAAARFISVIDETLQTLLSIAR